MREIGLFLALIAFSAVAAAQADNGIECPEISITGPAGITNPGDVMIFSVNVIGRIPDGVKYHWKVVDGEIESGQGTRSLRVRTPNKSSFNTVATVEVVGLPEGCGTTASASSPVACFCVPILIDEFGSVSRKVLNARIANFIEQLRDQPESRAFIILYFEPKTQKSVVDRRIGEINDSLLKIYRLIKEQFEVVAATRDIAGVRLFIVPPGAELPTP